jgi:thioesterase domain-containing protein/acyl carrier protein
MEDRLSQIWSRILQKDAGIDADFFDLGGDSLMAVGLFLEIEREFGVKLPITAIYDAPTIAGQAELIRSEAVPAFSLFVELKAGDEKQPFHIVHGVGGTVIELAALGKLIDTDRAVYAIQARGLDGNDAPLETVEGMAALYVEALRIKQPQGPYLIGGYSFGGVVALEMARLLGPENVAQLVMIDAYAHPHTWPLKTRATVRARKLLSRLKAYARNPVREAKAFVSRRMTDRATYVNNWLGAVNPDLPLPLRRTRIAGDAALIAYAPRPYAGHATFIRAGKTGSVFPSDARNVWGKLIAGFTLQTTQGDHRSILVEHAPVLAQRISQILSSPARFTRTAREVREFVATACEHPDRKITTILRHPVHLPTWVPFPRIAQARNARRG